MYLIELLLDDDAEWMEALSALHSLDELYADTEPSPELCRFHLLMLAELPLLKEAYRQ